VLAAEHRLDLGGIHLGFESVQRPRQIGGNALTLFRPLEQDAEVIELPLDRPAELDLVGENAPASEDLLRLALVLPEIRGREARFDGAQFAGRVRGVKESSASRGLASPGLRSGG
jgi:hypothetical protein